MAEIVERTNRASPERASLWSELVRKEDWWAIWIGLGLIAVAALRERRQYQVAHGRSAEVEPAVGRSCATASERIALRDTVRSLGRPIRSWPGIARIKLPRFLPAFLVIFVVTTALYFLGLWDQASR